MEESINEKNKEFDKSEILTSETINILNQAINKVRQIVTERKKEKKSSARAANIAKEINEIIKVMKTYLPKDA